MNRQAHAQGAGLMLALAAYYDKKGARGSVSTEGERLGQAVIAGGLGAACGSLPDLLEEPAIHPNHRQFFHSVAFGLVMAGGIRQVYRWQPEEPWQCVLRGAALIAGGAYLVHLAMDATTHKSLPLIGKF